MRELLLSAFGLVEGSIIAYVALSNLSYFILMAVGFFALRRFNAHLSREEKEAILMSPAAPGISVLAPAYNEALSIVASVNAQLRLRYPSHEVIVINDGSKDDTLKILIDEFHLYRSARTPEGTIETKAIRGIYESRDPVALVVVDKENGGKADSLNAGINVARMPLVAAVDSDSLLEPESLMHIAKPFLEDPEATLAVGGLIRVVNGCEVDRGVVTRVAAPSSFIARVQVLEYLRAFLGGRLAFSFLNCLLLISGAFGLFRRDALLAAGGFDHGTVGEDMEVVVRMQRLWTERGLRSRVLFVAEPVCWTEAPESWKSLQRQRNRWQRGTVETLGKHRKMFLNPRYGMVGMFGLPYFFFFEMVGPVIEVAGYVCTIGGLATGLLNWQVALLFFLASIVFGMMLTAGALVLEEFTTRRYASPMDLVRLLGCALIESFGYRQMMSFWRAKGVLDGLRGKKGWGKMERLGFQPKATK